MFVHMCTCAAQMKPRAPRAPFGTASRKGVGNYVGDKEFAMSQHRRELDLAIQADRHRTERAAVALRFGRQAPGYTGSLASRTQRRSGAVTAEEAVRANVDPKTLLLHPTFRREVVLRRALEQKVSCICCRG